LCPLFIDVLTVDRAVEIIGFGWFQVKLSIFTGLVWVSIFNFTFYLLDNVILHEVKVVVLISRTSVSVHYASIIVIVLIFDVN